MSLFESLRMSLRSLAANKLRAGLTMLGIIIGTGAVIALLAVGEGAQAEITKQIQGIGSNLIFVFSGRFDSSGVVDARPSQPLTLEDAQAIANPANTQYVAAVAPELSRNATITYRGKTTSVNLTGTTPEYALVRNTAAELGTWFSAAEMASSARVALLGTVAAETLFDEAELALGQEVRINQVPFRVVGILEEKGAAGGGFGGSQDNVAIVPITTAFRRLYSGRFETSTGLRVDLINISAVDEASMDLAIDEISFLLRERHGLALEEDDDFTVASQQDILGVFNQITSVLTIFLGAIAGISLLVGGIGIMNIMLVSVTERTREIGIRKAVGARRSDILWQFLIESVVLSVFGGLVGIALGWGIALLVNRVAEGVLTTVVSAQSIALAVGFSVAVGLFFGIYPASRASNLNPIQALRYE